MNILSIDSGIEKTGYAIFDINQKQRDKSILITSGLIKTSKYNLSEIRILEIYENLEKIIVKYKPLTIVIERLFLFHNQKTVIQVAQTQGITLLLAAKKKISVKFLTPLQIKQIITGYGNADKKAMQKMIKLILNITIPSNQDDEADAIACGLAYCYINQELVE